MISQIKIPLTNSLEKRLPPLLPQIHPLDGVREPVAFEKGQRIFKFWKIKALFTDEQGLTFKVYQRDDLIPKTEENKGRMAEGKAPLGIDGQEIELHHITQNYGGSLAELTHPIHNEKRLSNGTPYTDILHGFPPKKLKDYYAMWVSILTKPLENKDFSKNSKKKKEFVGLSKTKSKKQESEWLTMLFDKGLKLDASVFNPICGRREAFKEQKRAYWKERGKKLFGIE
jgi:hypothetical protein